MESDHCGQRASSNLERFRYPMPGFIFWSTMKLGEVVTNRKRDGKPLSPDVLAHVSSLWLGAHQSHRWISLAKAL